MTKYKQRKEVVLYGVEDIIKVPEIRVRYNKGKNHVKITGTNDAYNFLKKVFGRDISIQEQFVVLFIDNSLNVLGYYKHSVGTPTSVVVDIPMILGIALKSLSRKIIISHNHPSGNIQPSAPDRKLTIDFKEAAKILQIDLLDHLILTRDNGYYSFSSSENILAGIEIKKLSVQERLRQEILEQLNLVTPSNVPKVFQKIQTEDGYREIEQRIINLVVRDRITPSASIPQIENEL